MTMAWPSQLVAAHCGVLCQHMRQEHMTSLGIMTVHPKARSMTIGSEWQTSTSLLASRLASFSTPSLSLTHSRLAASHDRLRTAAAACLATLLSPDLQDVTRRGLHHTCVSFSMLADMPLVLMPDLHHI